MTATIKCFFGTWFVCPSDGTRGGILVASKADAIALCKARGWKIVAG